MTVEIDSGSGFCFGVVYAIQRAEDELKNNDKLYCLGDIVHNGVEVKRLKSMGLITINHQQLNELHDSKVLIRAHGEPPETYRIAHKNNIELLDASCPVVLRLQNRIKEGYDLMLQKKGQLVIYGKKGHAEVNGLVGQTREEGIVISSEDDLDKIDYKRPINIFSQTTKGLAGFNKIVSTIKTRALEQNPDSQVDVIANDTICRQVSHREPHLREFSKAHDVIIFVSGKKSSNGKMLFEVCKSENSQTYFISNTHEVDWAWFRGNETIGICGATSTPRWLMEKIRTYILDEK